MSEFVTHSGPKKLELVNPGGGGGTSEIEGKIADGVANTSKPVVIGGEDASGNVKTLQTADDGDLIVHQHSASTVLADGIANTMYIPVNQTDLGFLGTPVAPYYFNGTTWDRQRGDATYGAYADIKRFPEEASSSGTISALNEYVEHTVLQGASSLLINIAGTYTGELILQVDATGSGSWQYFKALNGQDFVSGLGANLEGFLFGPIANFKKVRMLASSWTSGSATVTIKTSVAAGTLFMAHPIPTGANLIGRTYKEPRAYTASTQSKATVGTTTGQVFAADSLIKGLYLKNTSLTATISLKWGSSAVAGEGIVLLPGDGMLFDDDFVQNSALNAISDTASTNLAYTIYH